MFGSRSIAVATAISCVIVAGCSPKPEAWKPLAGHPTCNGSHGYAASLDGQRTFLWRSDWLAGLKRDYAAKPDDFKTIIASADEALTHPRYSVVDKPSRPDGVGKHDYVSLALYWWPDSKSRNGLPYVERDGMPNPERNKSSYDAKRFTAMAKDVQALALASFLKGDRRYREKAGELVRAWFLDPATRMNPHLNFAQTTPGVSLGASSGVIEGARMLGVVESIGLIEGNGGLTSSDVAALRAWFSKYLDWMLESKNGQAERASNNNHGSWFDAQALSYALFSGRDDVAREIANSAAVGRIADQIESSGEMPEELKRTRSFHYSNYGLQALMDIATYAECAGIDLWHYKGRTGGGIEDSLRMLSKYAGREKTWERPELNILAVQPYLVDVLTRGAYIYGDPGLAEAASKASRVLTNEPVLAKPPVTRAVAWASSHS